MTPVDTKLSRTMTFALMALVLGGCLGGSKRIDEDWIKYRCDGGQGFGIEYVDGEDGVWIHLRTRSFKMNRVESASGAKYTNGTSSFWSKEDEAVLELRDGGEYANCKLKSDN